MNFVWPYIKQCLDLEKFRQKNPAQSQIRSIYILTISFFKFLRVIPILVLTITIVVVSYATSNAIFLLKTNKEMKTTYNIFILLYFSKNIESGIRTK